MNFLLAALIMMLAPQRVHIGQNVTVPNGGVTPPQVLTYNEAFYTSEARMNKVEGTVTVEAAFDKNGAVTILRTVKSLGAGVKAPTVVKRIQPEYRDEARAARLSGTVVLQAVIQPDGAAKVVKIVKPLDLGLTESAVTAIQQWKFNPAVRDGKEVGVSVNIEVNFNLEKKK